MKSTGLNSLRYIFPMGKRKGKSERHSRNMDLDGKVELRGKLGSPGMEVDPKDVSESNEVRFGRHLAHSSDKYTRDRTVGALHVWLRRRSKAGKLTDLDLRQIWKGLWYSMWLCDKVAVQLELAESLGQLIFVYAGQLQEGLRFFRYFCKTLQAQWGKVDHLRIDKYYTLIRVVLRESLRFCLRDKVLEGSESPSITGGTVRAGLLAFMDVLQDEILEKLPNGLRLHASDVFLDELWSASCQPASSASTLSTLEFLLALEPFFCVLQAGGVKGQGATSSAFFKRVLDRIAYRIPTDILYGDDHSNQNKGRGTVTSEEEGHIRFPNVSLPAVQGRVFALASDKATSDKNREEIYNVLESIQAVTMENGPGSEKSIHEIVRKMWIERKGSVSSDKRGIAVYGWAATVNGDTELDDDNADNSNNDAEGTGLESEVQKGQVATSSSTRKSKRKQKKSRKDEEEPLESNGTEKSGSVEEVGLETNTQETPVRKREKRNSSSTSESLPSPGLDRTRSSKAKIAAHSLTPAGKETKQQEERTALGRGRRRRVTFGETHFKPYLESIRHLKDCSPEKANAINITPSKPSLKKDGRKCASSENLNDEPKVAEAIVKQQPLTPTPTVKTRKKEKQRPQVSISDVLLSVHLL